MITIRIGENTPSLSVLTESAAGRISVNHNPLGWIVYNTLKAVSEIYPSLYPGNYMIMPDHIHFILAVRDALPMPLGHYIKIFKEKCSLSWWSRFPDMQDISFFSKGFHDRIILDKGQLARANAYILDNPRRLWKKRNNPDCFRKLFEVEVDGETFEAVGNIDLLGNPFIEQVQIHRAEIPAELKEKKKRWINSTLNGGILASPFISEAEKKARDWSLDNGGRIILLEAKPFADRFKPAGRYFDICDEGRLLILAPKVPYSDIKGRGITRAVSLHLNAKAQAIAQGRFAIRRK